MGTSSGSQNQQTQQNTISNPWAPTQVPLNNIINQIGQIQTDPNQTGQSGAAGALIGAANGLPNYGSGANSIVGNAWGGIPNLNQGVTNATAGAQGAESALLNPNNLNPNSNPFLGPAISGLSDQILGNINGQFAAAGRDLSPANSKAAAYGLGQALDPLLLSQYNTNVGNMLTAADQYFNQGIGANSAYGANANLGGNFAANQPTLATNPANAQLAAANTGQNLLPQNIGGLLGNLLPIAGLGGQVQGQGTSNTQKSYSPSIYSDILGGFSTLFPKGLQSGGGA